MGWEFTVGDGTRWQCLVGAQRSSAKYDGYYSLRCYCRNLAGRGISRVYEYRL